MARRVVAILLMSTVLSAATNDWKERLNLERLLQDTQALDSLLIAYTSFDNKLSLYIFGNGKVVTQPTVASTELVPTCTADISDQQVRALIQQFVDKRFFDLPRKDFIMLDASQDDWASLHLHNISITDVEGTAGRTFGTGYFNGEKQVLPENFVALRNALIQLRDSAFQGRDPNKPCRFEPKIRR